MTPTSQYLVRIATMTLIILSVVATSQARGFKRVYVYSEASEDYVASRSSDRPESYYFFEGLQFGGYTRDDSLRNVPFIDIAKGLAPHLARQDYWPATSKETCDLLLVVSWGTTNPGFYGDVSRRLFPDYYDGDYYDRIAEGEYMESEFEWYGKQRNSKLLGFYPFIRRDRITGISPHEEYELRSAMRTERYFMIVTAFDFQELLNNKQWKRLWSTRFNVRSPGINFYDAHEVLSKAGAAYFGKDLETLGKERADFEPVVAEVGIGEIEILETLDVPKGQGILNSLRISDRKR